MNRYHITFAVLSLASAALLSAGFLFPHCGGFALIGLVPLLWMDRIASENGVRRFWWWHYLTFVLWNAFTTFWVCNATVAGGIGAILANALQMSVIWAIFRLLKKRFKGTLPYIFLAAMWITWERFYFDAEISWPWLTLGNAFAFSHSCVQWYEVTGTLGGSLWVWACNLSIFGLISTMADGKWQKWNKKARTAAIAGTTLLFLGPLAASWIRYATFEENKSCGSLDVCLLQPNLDPYQKFQSMSQAQQNEVLTGLMERKLADSTSTSPLLFLAPETATNDIVLNEMWNSPTVITLKSALERRDSCGILFGASTYEFIHRESAPSYTARRYGDGIWYENRNSAVMIDENSDMGIYHKSRLVIGTEKMPWPRIFSKIDNALGGVMGRCVGQSRVSLLRFDGMPLGCAVCYESVYPEYFASYIKAGAEAMTVITNDAWWGDTPGYRQHLQYSCLRAIETRRDIARCANTGISAFINQRGDIISRTEWWTRTSLDGSVNLSKAITPFVRYGDIVGRVCSFIFLLLALALFVNVVTGAFHGGQKTSCK